MWVVVVVVVVGSCVSFSGIRPGDILVFGYGPKHPTLAVAHLYGYRSNHFRIVAVIETVFEIVPIL